MGNKRLEIWQNQRSADGGFNGSSGESVTVFPVRAARASHPYQEVEKPQQPMDFTDVSDQCRVEVCPSSAGRCHLKVHELLADRCASTGL